MEVGDTVTVTGVPPDVRDDERLKARSLLEKCVGRQFVVSGIEQPEGFPYRLIRLDVGHIVGEESFRHTVWLEEDYSE